MSNRPKEYHPSDYFNNASDPDVIRIRSGLIAMGLKPDFNSLIVAEKQGDVLAANMIEAIERKNAFAADVDMGVRDQTRLQVFGSARSSEQDPEYQRIYQVTQSIIRARISDFVQHGGAQGTMEAAGKAALEEGKTSVGYIMLSDKFSDELSDVDEAGWGVHPYSTGVVRFKNYDNRAKWMNNTADAYIISAAIGGGTLDELTTAFVEQQYANKKKPIVVFGDHIVGHKIIEVIEAMHKTKVISRGQGILRGTSFTEQGLIYFEQNNPDNVVNYLRQQLSIN